MVFKHNETITSLYEGITKTANPTEDQLVQQAPLLSKTGLSKDQDLLAEAYKSISKKCTCAAKGGTCDCDNCAKCRSNQKPLKENKKTEKPDYMDVDEDGDTEESMKKATKDKKFKKLAKEGLSFKDLFKSLMTE